MLGLACGTNKCPGDLVRTLMGLRNGTVNPH